MTSHRTGDFIDEQKDGCLIGQLYIYMCALCGLGTLSVIHRSSLLLIILLYATGAACDNQVESKGAEEPNF